MYKVVIDTATKNLYLAIVKDEKVVVEHLITGLKKHAEASVKVLQDSLKELSITIDDLDEVVVGVGPGSYTGVRIAVTVAKMIGSFKNIKVSTISTLYLISSGYDGLVVSSIDARRGNVFSSAYLNDEEVLVELLRNEEELKQMYINQDITYVTEDSIKIDAVKVVKKAQICEYIDGLVPNYLRITEAEYNLKNN